MKRALGLAAAVFAVATTTTVLADPGPVSTISEMIFCTGQTGDCTWQYSSNSYYNRFYYAVACPGQQAQVWVGVGDPLAGLCN